MALKLIALDLDGTLTQHRTPLGEKNRLVLEKLAERYQLLMVGAGTCRRIFDQMLGFPVDVIGNYGMQYARYDAAAGDLHVIRSDYSAADEKEVRRRAEVIRRQFGLQDFWGETIEIHPTGMLTFSLVGSGASAAAKLACDPDRSRRRAMYPFVCEIFRDYNVVIGGSSSFDLIPGNYGKCNALERFLSENGLAKQEVLYIGDDYEPGGGDHDVYASDIPFLIADNYDKFDSLVSHLLNN